MTQRETAERIALDGLGFEGHAAGAKVVEAAIRARKTGGEGG